MTPMPNLVPAYAEIFLALSGMTMLMVGVFRKADTMRGISLLAIGAFILAGLIVLPTNAAPTITFSGMFAVNAFTVFAKLLVLLGGIFAILLTLPWAENEGITRYELPVVMVLLTKVALLQI